LGGIITGGIRRKGYGQPVLGWTVEQTNRQGSTSASNLDRLEGLRQHWLGEVEPDLAFVLNVVRLANGQTACGGKRETGFFRPGFEEVEFGIDSVFSRGVAIFAGQVEAELVGRVGLKRL